MRFRLGHHARGEFNSWQEWWSEVDGPLETPCWRWKLAIEAQGYGVLLWEGRKWKAHRWVYWKLRGEEPSIPSDHLCRNKWCVNPNHLEQVSHRENVVRGVGPTANNAKKQYCKHGHPLWGENLIIRAKTGHRDCRECMRERSRRHQRKRRKELYADPVKHAAHKAREAAQQRSYRERILEEEQSHRDNP